MEKGTFEIISEEYISPQEPVNPPYQEERPLVGNVTFAPTKKKSKLPMVIATVIVGIVVVATLYFLVLAPAPEVMNYKGFLMKYDSNGDGIVNGTDDMSKANLRVGQQIVIKDEIAEVDTYFTEADYTPVKLKSVIGTNLNYMYFPIKGNQTDNYAPGDPIEIIWTIKEYTIDGEKMLLSKELYNMLMNPVIRFSSTTPSIVFDLGKSHYGSGSLEAEFIATSIDINWYDIKIIITLGTTQETWSINPDCSAFENSTSELGISYMNITDNAGYGCSQKINQGDHINIWEYTIGLTYTVKIFYINTEGIAGEATFKP